MSFMPVSFKIERYGLLPVLRITGMISPMPEIERILLYYAIKIIDKAKDYKGKIMNLEETDNMEDLPKNMTSVRFYIIFKNENDLAEAVLGISKDLG